MQKYPPLEVTRPWGSKSGDPVTVRLIFYTREKTAVQSNWFNSYRWKPALASAGLIKPLEGLSPKRPRNVGVVTFEDEWPQLTSDARDRRSAQMRLNAAGTTPSRAGGWEAAIAAGAASWNRNVSNVSLVEAAPGTRHPGRETDHRHRWLAAATLGPVRPGGQVRVELGSQAVSDGCDKTRIATHEMVHSWACPAQGPARAPSRCQGRPRAPVARTRFRTRLNDPASSPPTPAASPRSFPPTAALRWTRLSRRDDHRARCPGTPCGRTPRARRITPLSPDPGRQGGC